MQKLYSFIMESIIYITVSRLCEKITLKGRDQNCFDGIADKKIVVVFYTS